MGITQENKTNFFLALGVFSFIGMIALYVFEFPYIANTLNSWPLIKYSLLTATALSTISLIVGYAIGILQKDSLKLHVFMAVSFVLFGPLLGSLSNRKLTIASPYSITYDYLGQYGESMAMFGKEKGEAADSYWLNVKRNGKEYTFHTKTQYPQSKHTGNKVRLVMQKGFWGFYYFDGKSWEFL